jgi:4-diphosphocytidyl-2-C-methyl-D-erythritol kinase
VRACAKVNLTLRVLALRDDGYHELRTTFQSLALHDTLTLTRVRGPFAIASTDPHCPTDESNLVWKAAARLWDTCGRRAEMHGVHVHIAKRVPMQAGLGGGSSDAAAALRALQVLWKVRVSDDDLLTIARPLGADVAFFLEGGTVLGIERGDLLFPLRDREPSWVVIARPRFGVSTRDAYAWWDRSARSGRLSGPPDECANDLEAPVVARHPEIGALIRTLRRAGATHAAMSGSGSAVFGLFGRRDAAEAAAWRLARGPVNCWVTRTLNSRQYRRASVVRPISG